MQCQVFPSLALGSTTVGVAAVARSVAASGGGVIKMIVIARTLGTPLAGIWYALYLRRLRTMLTGHSDG